MHKFAYLPFVGLVMALAQTANAQDTSVLAQQDPVLSEEPVVEGSEIIVTGRSLRGQVNSAEAPILELDEEDIAAYGAGSIAELVEQLAPQTSSGRGRGGEGRPVFLVNGLRVSSFREFRSYPPEAIERVEVLPEEVAQQYGFPPNRRVMNFIMKSDFSSREVELEYEQPTAGGYSAQEVELTYLKLGEGSRLNFNAELNNTTLLTEAERDIVQTPGSAPGVPTDPDPAAFRSLVREARSGELTGNYTTRLGDSPTTVSVNGTFERNEGRSLSGLNAVTLTDGNGNSVLRTFDAANPLERRTYSDALSLGSTLNTAKNGWDVAVTADASRVWSTTEIDRRADTRGSVDAALAGTLPIGDALPIPVDAGFDTAETRSTSANLLSTFRGTLLTLPAGDLSATFDAGYSWANIRSEDTRGGGPVDLTRGILAAGANLSAPVFDNETLGYLTLNAAVGAEELSDFGTLGDWSLGATWNPTERLSLSASYIAAEAAPSLGNLGDPVTTTFNVPVFDFVTGDTVLANITSGGNPNLLAEQQNDWKISANWELPFIDDTRLVVEYFDNSSENVTAGFPLLTPDIEAAFPDRVTRAQNGTLLAIDQRPVTFARQDSSRISVGLNLRGSFGGSEEPPRQAEARSPRGDGEGRRAPASEQTEEQRQAFMALRERLCADDGMVFLRRLITAVENGETVAELPGLDPDRLGRFLDRARAADGTIDEARLAEFRERFCAFDPATMQRGQGGGERRGGGRRGGGIPGLGRDSNEGRYFLNLTYTRELDNTVQIAADGPILDLLDGDALTGGGVTQGAASLEGGVFKGGWGLRASARYSGSSQVLGTGLPGSTDLFFGDLATLDLRVFADLGQVIDDGGFWKGARVSFKIDNVFDTRREVVNSEGIVPLSYQPFLIDPIGRYVGAEVRKLF